MNELLSLSSSSKRRIWVILDEMASLQQLPYLISSLAEARKFGSCFIIGVQSYADIAKIYGDEGAMAISSLLNTRFIFRNPDPKMADWSAKNLGEITIEEVKEGISYGANSIRDGVSIQRVERQKPVVTNSEILRLDDLTCYVRLPGQYPITKLHFTYINRAAINIAFKERTFQEHGLSDEVLQLTDNFEVQSIQSTDQSSIQFDQRGGSIIKVSQEKKKLQKKEKSNEYLFQ